MGIIYEEVEELLGMLPIAVKYFRRGEEKQGYQLLEKALPKINQVYLSFIEKIPVYLQMGVDLSEGVILAQLNNMLDGFEYRDSVKLADTMEYELLNGLGLYRELLDAAQENLE